MWSATRQARWRSTATPTWVADAPASCATRGSDVRALADQLVGQTESLGWTGRAAESLDRHVHGVEIIQDTIAETEREVTALVAEARTRIARIARIESANESHAESGLRPEPDADDRTRADFTAPPSRHRDWLTVDLPGL